MASTKPAEDFLAHYGKKGMKWGSRKAPRRQSSDYKQTLPLRSQHVSTLSDKQLQKVNKRIEMESKYKKMNPTKVQKGENHVKAVMSTATLAIGIYNLAQQPAVKAMINKGRASLFNKVNG